MEDRNNKDLKIVTISYKNDNTNRTTTKHNSSLGSKRIYAIGRNVQPSYITS